MSDNPSGVAPVEASTVDPVVPEPVVDPVVEPDAPLGEGGKKALDAERAAVKQLKAELAEATAKNKSFEDRDKSELDKALERAEAAEALVQARKDADDADAAKAAKDAELAGLVAEIATAKSLDATAAAALRGSTREELEAHADILKPLLSSPLVIPGQGDTPDNTPSEEAAFVRGLFGSKN